MRTESEKTWAAHLNIDESRRQTAAFFSVLTGLKSASVVIHEDTSHVD